MANISQLLWTSAVWGVVAAGTAAVIAGWLSHRVKISEFRQRWIDDLRKDITEYVGAARKWYRTYQQVNDSVLFKRDTPQQHNELSSIDSEARVILYRIRLRFNPRQNQYKIEDDSLLQKLDDLLDPKKISPLQREASWDKLASEAVDQAREILKREWEATKHPWAKVFKRLNVFGLLLGMVGVVFIFIWGPPQPSFQQGISIGLEDANVLPNGKTVAQNNVDIAKKENHYRCMSEIGLMLIFLGFLSQFAGALASKD